METIGVADLETYWITFEQLLQRWKIKENLLASYCVCVDTSKGNPPLSPHFYQGEFPIPGGEIWKRLAKYEPEYKNATDYLNKSKTESQLVQEFLASISSIKRDTILFLLSSVEELEKEDYSLAMIAQDNLNINKCNDVNTLVYVSLDNPITFREIFSLWVGEDQARKVFSHNASYIYSDNDLDLIRAVENQLVTSVYNGELKTFHEREAAGRRLFYETTINLALPSAGVSDGICANLIFMFHTPACPTVPSEPVYFESAKIFQKFPFLNLPPVRQESPPPTPSTGSAKDKARIEATRQACDTIRAEIEKEKHGFQVNDEYKTNRDHFLRAVGSILDGINPHRDTVREEWKKVSEALKHSGRVPDQ